MKEDISDRIDFLLNNIEGQIWYMTSPSAYGMVNKARADFLGVKPEEIAYKNMHEILTGSIAEPCIESNREIFETGIPIKKEEWVQHHSGEKRLLSIRKIPKLTAEGSVEYILCCANDITVLKRKEVVRQFIEEKLRILANSDELTGLYNRRHFMSALANEIERAGRYGQPFSLIMIDLDHFKKINDAHGHDAGDHVLRQFSTDLKNTMRQLDTPARLGGEEFAAILPQTGAEKAQVVAERFRAKIENTPAIVDDVEIYFTVSIGVAAYQPEMSGPDDLLKMADEALYEAKRTGRNRVLQAKVSVS